MWYLYHVLAFYFLTVFMSNWKGLVVILFFHEFSAPLSTMASSHGIKTSTDKTTTSEDLQVTSSESDYDLFQFQFIYYNLIVLNFAS